jgi:serine/threonine protein kinase
VEALLNVNDRAGSFLEPPAPVAPLIATVDEPITERPGTLIGPYKLMEQIGEGGMGLVFVAEQQQPVRRKVALKVMKPGMDTRQVVARFEAERQALALMDHPHIAQVHDGGQTVSGRPYFVMELVKGVPITEYCDQNQVAVRARLELFLAVCQAVQHAHQKGIIHRDLKPSNVLVASHDGQPVVKVIDFGVAKAIGQQLTDKTLYTHFTQLVGTPLYMSPEQAGQSSLDIDTRSDIYSLGVLLYELLTGTTPFAKERFSQVGYDEMRRIIREEEPPKPSTRISTLGQAATTVSTQRKSDAKHLSQLFRGELDWIVMKALEKDRNRRYATANDLARDIERYLHDEPVEACPPSAAYKLRKFAQKYRAPLRVAAAFVFLTVAGGTISTVLIIGQRDEARLQRRQAEANFRKARRAVDDYYTRMSESTLLNHPTLEPLRKRLLQSAVAYYEEFVREHGHDPELQAELVAACFRITNMVYGLGMGEDWLAPFEQGVAVMEDLMGKVPDLAALRSLRAGIFRPMATYLPTPRPAEALRALEKSRAIWGALVRAHPDVPGFKSDLAFFQGMIGIIRIRQTQHAEAAQSLRHGCDLARQASAASPGTPHYRVMLGMGLALLHQELGELGSQREAEEVERRALEVTRKLAADFPDVPYYREVLAWSWDQFAHGWQCLGRLREEEEAWRQQLATYDQLTQAFPTVPRFRGRMLLGQQHLAELLWGDGRRAEATELFRKILDQIKRINPEDADALDTGAWFLATCPEARLRDARRAVDLARRATTLAPQEQDSWTTLGAALYRAGDWRAAIEALGKARAGPEASAWNFLFLAMAQAKLGRGDWARRCYDEATVLMGKSRVGRRELSRLRAEAEQVLGIEQPAK